MQLESRVFNIRLPGARMKLVGGDSGRHEREEFVEEVLLAPSERVIVDVLFDQPGELALEHHTPERSYSLAAITVTAQGKNKTETFIVSSTLGQVTNIWVGIVGTP